MHGLQFTLYLVVFGISCRIACAQQANAPMPPAAAGIVAQMDKEILASKKKAVDALERVLKETTKRGDLAGAMAVKQKVDRLKGDIAGTGPAKGDRGGSDIVGRWRGQGWTVEFLPDGSATCSENGMTGTWVADGASVEVTFTNGITHSVTRTADGWTGVYKSGGKIGGNVNYTRLP